MDITLNELERYAEEEARGPIGHFQYVHFRGLTINDEKFVYCPVGNICSWSAGDYDHSWCQWCKKYFDEIK